MLRRRRRPARDIPFSFDSFLDVVANVVGIIIRLILVAWVGARAYKCLPPGPPVPLPAEVAEEPLSLPEVRDPLADELERQRRHLDAVQARLAEELDHWQRTQGERASVEKDLASAQALRQRAAAERQQLESAAQGSNRSAHELALSLDQLRERGQRLRAEIDELTRSSEARKTLRYRTPVSRVLQSEELQFECRAGRVTPIDVASLLDEVRSAVRAKGEELRSRWEVEDVTAPVGAFRLRYIVERERGLLDGVGAGGTPDDRATFRYGVSAWIVEPVVSERGETAAAALAPGSAFRKILDALDPGQTAITFWVYPDSFALYRQLRDALHERDVVVAGRPLPEGIPIASSRHGTASRGQ